VRHGLLHITRSLESSHIKAWAGSLFASWLLIFLIRIPASMTPWPLAFIVVYLSCGLQWAWWFLFCFVAISPEYA
jgi:hypothetical protein